MPLPAALDERGARVQPGAKGPGEAQSGRDRARGSLLVPVLKSLLMARTALALYPGGSELARNGVRRLHRALEGFFEKGFAAPIQVTRDGFLSSSEKLVAPDSALEAFRFDLELRGIAEFTIEPGVQEWELQAFAELLNVPAVSLDFFGGAPAYLAARHVIHVRVSGPATGAPRDPDTAGDLPGGPGPGKDALDGLDGVTLAQTEERLAQLAYDRAALTEWFDQITRDDHVERLYPAASMLASRAERDADCEVQLRTLVEALFGLPEAVLRPFLTRWLIPLVARDRTAFNLLTQMTADELDRMARLVPSEQLLELSSQLMDFPWDEGQRHRLLEALTAVLDGPEEPRLPLALVPEALDDSRLAELRDEIIASCGPGPVLERGMAVLVTLVLDAQSEEPTDAVEALADLVGEALAQGMVDPVVRALRRFSRSEEGREGGDVAEWSPRLTPLHQRVADRTYVSLLASWLRGRARSEDVECVVEYLRLVGRKSVEEFVVLLAEEKDRKVRVGMCHILARLGPLVVPVLMPWLSDHRWYVVRNIVYVLSKLRDDAALGSVERALDHPHPRVRLEALRAVGAVGGSRALIRCARDPDRLVSTAAVQMLGTLRDPDAATALQALVMEPGSAAMENLAIREEAVRVLAAMRTSFAREALEAVAQQPVWFWQRQRRHLRALARAELRRIPAMRAGVREDRDGG